MPTQCVLIISTLTKHLTPTRFTPIALSSRRLTHLHPFTLIKSTKTMNLLTRFFGPRRRAATENCSKRQPDTPSSDAKKTRKSTTSRKSSLSSTATSTSNESETLASASHSRRSQSKANVNASLAAKKQEVKFDCSRCIRSTEIEYQLVTIVVKSWEQKILKIPNWDIRTGDILLRHCFRLAPVTM